MNLRTVLIVLACIFLAGIIIAAGADDPDQADKPATRPETSAVDDNIKRAIVGDDDIIRATLGQRLELTVEADVDDSVQAFGQTETVGPNLPAMFSVLLDEVGTHGVKLVGADKRVGRVVVTEPEGAEATPKEPAEPNDPRRSPPATSGGTAPGA